MATNPYVNKVEYAGQTVMDLTGDTATPSDVLNGATFHDRSGAPQTGSLITHDVYDGLDSTSTSDALSANQGKVLSDKMIGFYADNTLIETLSALITKINARATGDIVLYRVNGTVLTELTGRTISRSGPVIMTKASSNNAYYYALDRDRIAYGNVSISNGTVSIMHNLAREDEFYDGLDSTSTTKALTANQGKVLNDTFNPLIVGATQATDANDAVTQGIPYYIGDNGSNVPEDWVYIRVLNRDNAGTYISQIAYPMNYQSADKIWFRQKNGSGWGDWIKFVMESTLNNTVPVAALLKGTSKTNYEFWGVYGYITDSGKKVYLHIPVKLPNTVRNMTITSLTAAIRHVGGGYVGGSGSANLTSYISEISVANDVPIVRIILNKSDGWGLTNNTPVSGNITMSFSLS